MSISLIENYYALLVCILTKKTPEQAFLSIGCQGQTRDITMKKYRRQINEDTTKNMIEMRKQGMTYREIGKKHGVSSGAAYKRIQRYRERTARRARERA
jgi:DNA invertase Pin-like site-specific DNA recombinase